MFDAALQDVISKIDGAVGALIMGLDGISVARAVNDPSPLDVDVVAAEYTSVLRNAMRNAADVPVGALREIALVTDRFAFLLKPITSEYFLVLVLESFDGLGRARFELRKTQLALEEEFSL
jgi:predicted regulator of Ras-like GTPase activity (Roadblock/LC7/MglB family)